MPTFDAQSGWCRVLTFKEGMLSAIAHDLELEVTRWSLTIEGGHLLSARFEAGSLRVLHAMHDGKPTSQLSASDRAKIEKTLREEVLGSARHPEITFSGEGTAEGEGFAIRGTLTLCGKARPLTAQARPSGDRLVAEATVNQPDFGIRPYSAMLGALKVRPQVIVRVSVPWPLPASPGSGA